MLFQDHICSFPVLHVWSPGHLAFFLHYIHPHCPMLRILILQKILQRWLPFTVTTGLLMVLAAGSFVLLPPLETGHLGWEERDPHGPFPSPSPSPHTALCSRGARVEEGGWQLPAQPRVRMGPSLGTTVLPEWLGLIAPKLGFQTSPRVLWILPCLRDHAKSADLKYSLSEFLFYVTFINEARSTSKELMLTTPHSSIRYFCKQDFFFFFLGFSIPLKFGNSRHKL